MNELDENLKIFRLERKEFAGKHLGKNKCDVEECEKTRKEICTLLEYGFCYDIRTKILSEGTYSPPFDFKIEKSGII